MRQIIASAVVAAIVFTAVSPTLAQRSPRQAKPVAPSAKPVPPAAKSFADFDTIEAVTSGTGVVIRWTMKQETRVAFYQVYRVDAKGRTAVDKPVLGSGAHTNAETRYGEDYSAYDPAGTGSSVYEIEAMSLAGGGQTVSPQTAAKFSRGADLAIRDADAAAAASAVNSSIEKTSPADGPSQAALTPDPVNQKWVAAQPGAKIAVKKDGLYRVTRAELQAAGFNLAVNSANWRLFESGNEQPMIVGAGDQYIEFIGKGLDKPESDTRMYYLIADTVPGARMQNRVMRSFGGTAFVGNFRTTVEMKERTNYLNKIFNGPLENFWGALVTNGGATETFVLPNVDAAATDPAIVSVRLQGYSSTPHEVQPTLNGHALSPTITGGYAENFVRQYTVPVSYLADGTNSLLLSSTSSGDYTLFDTVTVTYTQKFRAYQNQTTAFTPGRRKVDLSGFSSPAISTVRIMNSTVAQPTASSTTPTTVASTTNGLLRLSAPTYLAGTGGSAIARITVSRVFGSTGPVTADLALTNGTATGGASCGAGVDYVFPASPTVSLADGIVARDVDVQICAGNIADPNGETFTATLSNPTGGVTLPPSKIRLFDLTYDAAQTLSGATTTQNGNNYGVTIPSYRGATIFAVDESYSLQAASVTVNTPSTLSVTSNAADVLIVSYSSADMIAASNSWASYRQSATGGSFDVKVVDVADIYDEFNYGVPSAQSLIDFFGYAYSNWQTTPRYVLLVGDGSYDPRNYTGYGSWNLIPVRMLDLVYEESASDEALTDFNGDGLAEIAIGRIPARDGAFVNQMLAKTQAQETAAMQSFSRGAAFIHDQPIGYDFEGINTRLRNELPSNMPVTFVMRGVGSPPNDNATTLQQAISALNTGPYIVNYSGHGASGLWGSPGWFTSAQVSQLTNSNQSIYTMLTCFNGNFQRNVGDCLAEVLLKSSAGGASMAWASTTETTPDVQELMALRFYNQLNAGTIKRVGDLIKDAKTPLPAGDVRYSWALLGDPATKVRP